KAVGLDPEAGAKLTCDLKRPKLASIGRLLQQNPFRRIVQCKMSMKLANWVERFPMQDEHEKRKNGVGVARPGASVHEECREPEPGTDRRVSQVERTDRVCGLWEEGKVRLGGARTEGPEVRRIGQMGARHSASLREKSNGDER